MLNRGHRKFQTNFTLNEEFQRGRINETYFQVCLIGQTMGMLRIFSLSLISKKFIRENLQLMYKLDPLNRI